MVTPTSRMIDFAVHWILLTHAGPARRRRASVDDFIMHSFPPAILKRARHTLAQDHGERNRAGIAASAWPWLMSLSPASGQSTANFLGFTPSNKTTSSCV